MALEAADVVIPPDGAEVIFVLVVEAHGAKSAARRARADAAARHDVRVAQEGLAVGREGGRVVPEAGRHVVARVQLVDLVRAVARRVGAVADEDLDGVSTLFTRPRSRTALTPPTCRFWKGQAVTLVAVRASSNVLMKCILNVWCEIVCESLELSL